jgi:hypothetical protein
MMSAEGDTGVIIGTNEEKNMKVKPLYKNVNLRYILFQTPGKRRKKTRTKTLSNPDEDTQKAGRR